MISEFGKYVRAVRLLRGLRIVDVVRRMGIPRENEAKPIRQLLELERSGRCPPRLFGQIAEALDLDPERLAQLADEHEQNVERILNMEVTPTLRWFRRWGPTCFWQVLSEEHLPVGTTIPEALARASQVARDKQVEVTLLLSRRQSVIVNEAGVIKRIERQTLHITHEQVILLGRKFRLRVWK